MSNNHCTYATEVGSVLRECLQALKQIPQVSIAHVCRQGNTIADALSRLALGIQDRMEWTSLLPAAVEELIAADLT